MLEGGCPSGRRGRIEGFDLEWIGGLDLGRIVRLVLDLMELLWMSVCGYLFAFVDSGSMVVVW